MQGNNAEDQVFAIPTLLKRHPLPLRRLIGDLSDTSKLRSCLGLF
ncbi:circadian clock KaiB family protein [Nostoc sp.]